MSGFWTDSESGDGRFAGHLRKNGPECLFLTKEKRCSIYPHRPHFCRRYPFQEIVYRETETDIDLTCPGIRYDESISREQIAEASASEKPGESDREFRQRVQVSVRQLESILRKRAGFIPVEIFEVLTDEIFARSEQQSSASPLDLFRQGPLWLGGLAPALNKIQDRSGAREFVRQLRNGGNSEQREVLPELYFEETFREPVLATRLDKTELTIYEISCREKCFHLEFSDVRQSIPFADVAALGFEAESPPLLLAYLCLWSRRQLMLRYAYSSALIDFQGRNYPYFVLSFLLEIFMAVCWTSRLLAKSYNMAAVRASDLQEAIRLCENVHRKKCHFRFNLKED